jgi:hypothetical protein
MTFIVRKKINEGEGNEAASVKSALSWVKQLVEKAQVAQKALNASGAGPLSSKSRNELLGDNMRALADLVAHVNGMRHEDWYEHFFH